MSVNSQAEVEGQYEEVAFETNNFVAVLWFCMVSPEQFERYSKGLNTTWTALHPHLNEEEYDELPEWEAFGAALNWHIPWPEAAAQMRCNLPITLARYPALGPLLSDWLGTLYTHIEVQPSPVIHLELGQFFDFYGEPEAYLKQLENTVSLWWDPDECWFAREYDYDIMTAYLLGGEPLPKREFAEDESAVETQGVEEIEVIQEAEETEEIPAAAVTPAKGRPNWLKETFIWLLAVLLAAFFIGTLALTSSFTLALLAFLLPVIVFILWEWLRRPKRRPAAAGNRQAQAPKNYEMSYYGGPSPLNIQGIEAVQSEGGIPFIVLWAHLELAVVTLPHQLELTVGAEFEHRYPSPAIVVLNEELAAEHVASAANSMVKLAKE